jgi:hypothetical protein
MLDDMEKGGLPKGAALVAERAFAGDRDAAARLWSDLRTEAKRPAGVDAGELSLSVQTAHDEAAGGAAAILSQWTGDTTILGRAEVLKETAEHSATVRTAGGLSAYDAADSAARDLYGGTTWLANEYLVAGEVKGGVDVAQLEEGLRAWRDRVFIPLDGIKAGLPPADGDFNDRLAEQYREDVRENGRWIAMGDRFVLHAPILLMDGGQGMMRPVPGDGGKPITIMLSDATEPPAIDVKFVGGAEAADVTAPLDMPPDQGGASVGYATGVGQ